ncbi:MAG: hypothetical protein HYR98_07240, partial [Nitrospirae bacterium]|nr:hypothetical protein [Nitrospirota bacterium]
IQKAKDAAFGVLGSWDVPKAAKAEAVVAVERALSGFPVYDLPQGELDEIAAGVRDRVYAPYKRIQKQREEEAAGRRQIEADRRAQKFALTLKKSVLVSYALSYARQEWEIDFLDWSEVEREILAAVDRELSGDESEADVRDLVDRVVGG